MTSDVQAASGTWRGLALIPDTLAFLAFCSRFKISHRLRAVREGSLLILPLANAHDRNVHVRRANRGSTRPPSREVNERVWKGGVPYQISSNCQDMSLGEPKSFPVSSDVCFKMADRGRFEWP